MTDGNAYNGHDGTPGQGSRRITATPLLALYPGLRQTGWAVLGREHAPRNARNTVAASGTSGLGTRLKLDPQERIAAQLEILNGVADLQHPVRAILSRAGGMNREAHGVRLLGCALDEWAKSRGMPLTVCSAADVRAAVAGRSNASKDELAYAVMQHLGLIGQSRSSQEWEAIAAGYYHLVLGQSK